MRKAILATIILIVPALAFVGGSEDAQAWQAKADTPLLEAYDAGQDPLTIIVKGPPIPAPAEAPEDRAAWRVHWEAHSTAFLGSLRDRTAALGGTVTTEVPAVNAAFVTIPNHALGSLLEPSQVRLAGLDWEGAIEIMAEPAGPGIMADLSATVAKVQAPDLWALGYEGDGVTLAVIDTGIRSTHEMMRNADGSTRVTKWYDATGTSPGHCPTPCDTNGHGTHVATTAAGSNVYNPSSPKGVAPEVEVWGVRIFRGSSGAWEWGQAGLQWAFDEGADITTNSWGQGDGGCTGAAIVTAELAETLQNAGMMNVFAAGNAGSAGVGCPGRAEKVLTVGGIDVNDNIYASSSRGPCTWPLGSGNTRICPDVNAVAVNVVAGWHTSDTAYMGISGTSMATPHVAGIVVLLEQAKRAVKGEGMNAALLEAEVLLRYTAKDLGPVGPDNDFGWGTAQGLDAHDLLMSTEAGNLVDNFVVGLSEMRASDTSALSFGLVNLGAQTLTGHVTHKVEQIAWGDCPSVCYEQVITDAPLSLTPFTEYGSAGTVSGAVLPAGDYRVTATFAYSYEEDGDIVTKLVEHEGFFSVLKIEFRLERLVPESATTGSVLDGGLVLRNVGNEPAMNVRFREVFRADGFTPLPPTTPGEPPYGAFANPAPTTVSYASTNPPALRYEFGGLGTIPGAGATWEADYNLLATQPGSYLFSGTLWYFDGAGTQYITTLEDTVVVTLP